MALPPLPANNTVRGFMDYTSRGVEHTLMFRLSPVSLPSHVASVAARLATSMVNCMATTDSIFGVRYAAHLSDVTLPVTWATVSGALTSPAAFQEDPESAFISVVGRGGTTGRKARISFFEALSFSQPWPADNRYNPGDVAAFDTWFATFLTALRASPTLYETLVTIGNDVAVWYDYANVAKNAYWQREQR